MSQPADEHGDLDVARIFEALETQPISTSRFAVSKAICMNGAIGMNGIVATDR